MTDAEKTEWRIRAAKAVGYTVKRITRQAFLVFPDAYEKRCWYMPPDIPDGQWEACTWESCVLHDLLPNPFESAEDCEALLVATLDRRASELPVWKGTGMGSDMGAWWFGIDGHQQGVYIRTKSHRGQIEIETWSDNPDRRAAYRESIVQACVRAFEAQEKAEIHPAKPLAEGNSPPRK